MVPSLVWEICGLTRNTPHLALIARKSPVKNSILRWEIDKNRCVVTLSIGDSKSSLYSAVDISILGFFLACSEM